MTDLNSNPDHSDRHHDFANVKEHPPKLQKYDKYAHAKKKYSQQTAAPLNIISQRTASQKGAQVQVEELRSNQNSPQQLSPQKSPTHLNGSSVLQLNESKILAINNLPQPEQHLEELV